MLISGAIYCELCSERAESKDNIGNAEYCVSGVFFTPATIPLCYTRIVLAKTRTDGLQNQNIHNKTNKK